MQEEASTLVCTAAQADSSSPLAFGYRFTFPVQGVFRGLGDTRTPLVATLGCNALNLALDPLLIFALGWGVAGAAQATVLAEVHPTEHSNPHRMCSSLQQCLGCSRPQCTCNNGSKHEPSHGRKPQA